MIELIVPFPVRGSLCEDVIGEADKDVQVRTASHTLAWNGCGKCVEVAEIVTTRAHQKRKMFMRNRQKENRPMN